MHFATADWNGCFSDFVNKMATLKKINKFTIYQGWLLKYRIFSTLKRTIFCQYYVSTLFCHKLIKWLLKVEIITLLISELIKD